MEIKEKESSMVSGFRLDWKITFALGGEPGLPNTKILIILLIFLKIWPQNETQIYY